MSKEKRYDIKSAKVALLDNVGYAYFALGRANGKEIAFEEELIGEAMYEVLEKDTGSRKQFKRLVGLSYMVRGIADNLRLLSGEPTQIDFNENEQLF